MQPRNTDSLWSRSSFIKGLSVRQCKISPRIHRGQKAWAEWWTWASGSGTSPPWPPGPWTTNPVLLEQHTQRTIETIHKTQKIPSNCLNVLMLENNKKGWVTFLKSFLKVFFLTWRRKKCRGILLRSVVLLQQNESFFFRKEQKERETENRNRKASTQMKNRDHDTQNSGNKCFWLTISPQVWPLLIPHANRKTSSVCQRRRAFFGVTCFTHGSS